jgi:integrase
MASGRATLPDTKSGESVRTLGAPALAVLEAQQEVKDNPYVFPGRSPEKRVVELQRLWYAARHHAGLADVRLHDLRHSVASVAGGHGYSLFLIGKLLGHRDSRSTERYAHLADDARKAVADGVGEAIRSAIDSKPAVVAARTA